MDPSEELQQLRARIALLERQKTINTTPTSSRASFDLMAQNENEMGYAADILCGQNDEIVPINGKKAMADQQQEEEQTKADQMEHLRGKIKQIELELNDMKQLNAELLARIEELECKQKADQQKEHRAKIDERQQEGGRGGGQGGSGFGRPNRDNEGGLSNDFSGGGGSRSSGNDGFSNSGFGNSGRSCFLGLKLSPKARTGTGAYSIKVANIPYAARVKELRQMFDRYGDISDVYIPRDRFTHHKCGFGFVRYYSRRDAEYAVSCVDGRMLCGRKLQVSIAKYGRPINEEHERGSKHHRSRSRSPLPRRSRIRSPPRRHDSRLRSRSPLRRSRIFHARVRDATDGTEPMTRRTDGLDILRSHTTFRQQEGGRGGGQGGSGGFGRHTEGGGLPSNDFSGGGGSGSSGNDGFSNSGFGNSAADDGTHNAPDVIFEDDVIRNKWAPPIGHNAAKTELGEAELLGIEEDVPPSGEPALNSPCAKKVKKEEPN